MFAALASVELGRASPPLSITRAEDLGLAPADIPVSSGTKPVYLVNPLLSRPLDLEAALRSPPPSAESEDGFTQVAFTAAEARALAAPGRPGGTAGHDAVADVAERFFQFLFSQPSQTERTLARLVEEVRRADFPLVTFNAVPRMMVRGGERRLSTLVEVRVFMIHLEGDPERDLRWVARCELVYEDSAVGEASFRDPSGLPSALASSVLDALRGKIAVSFARSPALRRASGRIEEPRTQLIEESISQLAPDPARGPLSAFPGAAPAAPPGGGGR
jgi:hypothetical protein